MRPSFSRRTAKPTNREVAYGVIRREICLGRMRRGAKVNERQLAERLGMSRIPVREALLCLHGEGLIALSGKRGMKVAEVKPQEMLHQVQFRSIVECAAAELAAERATADQIEQMLAEVHRQEILVRGRDWQALLESDLDFHRLILQASGNPFIVQTATLPAMGLIYLKEDSGHYPRTVRQHADIVDAIRFHRAREAQRLIHEHLTEGPF